MAKTKWKTVAIIGVGLIGGSIGLALRRRGLAKTVIGIGRRASSLKIARRVGAVTHTTTSVARGVSAAELIVVSTPVDRIVGLVQQAAAACPPGALITDAGSVKARIVSELEETLDGVRFVGSHPLAGSEKNGPAEANAKLFEGRVVVVTPSRKTPAKDHRAVGAFWSSLGAKVVRLSPGEHDRAIAATSHLPHLVAAATAASTPSKDLPLCATGWVDSTRIAAGDPELWTQILLSNREHVLHTLESFDGVLDDFHAALARGDAKCLRQLLTQAKRRRDAVGD